MTNTQFACSPQELRDRPQWVTWKYINGTKVPFDAKTGDTAKSNDPATWATFDEACEAAQHRHHAGIGYVFAADDPYTGIDLDDCIDDAGAIKPIALDILATLDSYAEASPSKKGIKIIVRGGIPASVTPTPLGDGVKIEMYSQVRFFTVTGWKLPDAPAAIRDVNGELTALYRRARPEQPKPARPKATPQANVDTAHARRYALAALAGEHEKMLAEDDGGRHWRRYNSAKALAGFIPHITEDEIFDALSVNFGQNRRNAEKTIRDGIAAGAAAPREIPENQQPDFDAEGHACCPTDGKRLVACFNGNGWRCPTIGESLCFWWQGDDYTPPAEIAIDDLDSLSPDELRQRLRAAVADRDRWKARAEHLDEWRAWALELAAIPTERVSPAAKVVAFSLYPEIKSRESRGVVEEQRIYIGDPKKKDGAAVRAGLSPGTYGAKLKELKHVGALDRTEDRQADGKKKVLIQPTAFLHPASWAPPEPRNHGGQRPTDRPAPACPTHGEDAPIVEETTETWLHVCGTCEKPLNAGQRKPQRRTIWEPNTQIAGSHDDAGGDDTNTQLARIEKTVDLSPNTQVAGSSPGATVPLAASWLGTRRTAGGAS